MTVESVSLEKTFTQADFDRFAVLSGDDNPIHVDAGYAGRTRFGRTVCHGMLLNTVIRGMLDQLLPGSRQASLELMFPEPTFAGDAMRFDVRICARQGNEAQAAICCTRVADKRRTCEGIATMRTGALER